MKYFEEIYKPKSIVYHSNRRWETEIFEEATGFSFIKSTNPNFFFFKINEGILLSPEKSLNENTEDLYKQGYRKIFDCGNKKYLKEYKWKETKNQKKKNKNKCLWR